MSTRQIQDTFRLPVDVRQGADYKLTLVLMGGCKETMPGQKK